MASELRVTTIANNAGTESVGSTYVINGSAKAWILFDGTGTIAISDSFGVSSIADNGTGAYTVTVTNAFSTSDYCVAESLAVTSAVACTYNNYTTNTSTAYKIGNRRVETTAFHDAKRANEAFFGDLA